ncbi:pseudouridine synthase [Synechococcus sp. CB0101]|uniref:pseudouridine synthase n=1 Tax=Synechococcus sp. CB0101 TaxID=232348 RepID=UPI000200111F|nr:pseudouridine synthase [Synechococcus sp. CB0101]QCH14503.1 pseudouridine synthase [Synechococcus sp. CB0101]
MASSPGLLSTLLFYKPYGVLSQFTPEPGSRWGCLADHIPVPDVYTAGRLDADSEGLLLLTANGRLQQRLTDPAWGHWRRYWVQVEGIPDAAQLQQLEQGLVIQGQRTLPARANAIADPDLPPRDPPIRSRQQIPTSWLAVELREGRNRQVRRMTAAVGLPTLRLLRVAIDLMDGGAPLSLDGLEPGQWRAVTPEEERRLQALLRHPRRSGRRSPGRGGRAGGGKSGQGGGGG